MNEMSAPNVSASLFAIHSVITRGQDVAAERTAIFGENGMPEGELRQGYINYLHCLVSVLEGHHLTEDELVFPYLQKIIPDAPYDDLVQQHREMTAILTPIAEAVEALRAGSDDLAALNAILQGLSRLQDFWHPHIEIEEQFFSPEVAAKLIEPSEHLRLMKAFAEHSQQHTGPDYLVLPFVLFNLPPGPRQAMLASLPKEVSEILIPKVWREKWASMGPFLLE
jgi:hemerythrin-like domain-containing protein